MRIAIILAFLVGCTDAAPSAPEPLAFAAVESVAAVSYTDAVDVGVIVGQSNALAGAKASDLPQQLAGYAQPYPPVAMAHQLGCPKDGAAGTCQTVQGWTALAPRSAGGNFGVELSLGRSLDGRYGDVALIKTATNGTGIGDQWEPGGDGTGTWQWDYAEAFVAARLAELPTGSRVRWVFVVGFEADASRIESARAVDDELVLMAQHVRATWGSDVQLVVSEMSAPGLNYPAEVSLRQWRAATLVPGLFVAETGGLVFRDQVQHYDAESFITLGQRMADVLP